MLVGPPGCGKTNVLLAEMAGVPGRYLFALPTTELIEEKPRDLHREAAKSGTEPVIRAIHSNLAGTERAGRALAPPRAVACPVGQAAAHVET